LKVTEIENNPVLEIEGKKIYGNYSNKFLFYPDKDIAVFSNDDVEDKELRISLFNLIKDLEGKDIPENLQFHIIPWRLSDPIPKPIDITPFPFRSVTIGKSDNDFFVRFDTFMDEIDEESWSLKWASEFYFKNLKKLEIRDEDIKIFEIPYTGLSSLYVQINFSEKVSIENAVNRSISKLKNILNQVELRLSGLEDFFDVIEIWHNNSTNKKEQFWQKTLSKYSWLLSQCFSSPLVLFKNEAFLGGKNLDNKGAKIIDFVLQNKLNENLSLVEIKTPSTKLVGKKYRSVHRINNEITGSICQLLDYREQLFKDFYSLKANSKDNFTIFNPSLVLIVGTLEGLTNDEKKSFELFRRDLKSIEIITFDELFEKVFMQIELMNKKLTVHNPRSRKIIDL
jgi:hypothetical protein